MARLTRLWTVLIPALIATKLVDLALAAWAPEVLDGRFRPHWNSGPDADYAADGVTFLANVLFLQTVVAPVFGTNGPLWSLANEFWYYVLFPILMVALAGYSKGRRLGVPARAALGLWAVALMAWLPISMLEGFLVWGLGLLVFVSLGRVPGRFAALFVVAGVPLLAAALGYSKAPGVQQHIGIPPDLVVGAAFCVLAVGLVNLAHRKPAPAWFARLATLISDISYSLYLVHFPVVMLIGGCFYRDSPMRLDATALAHFGAWLAALLALGYAFHVVFERRTPTIRRRVEQLAGIGPRRA